MKKKVRGIKLLLVCLMSFIALSDASQQSMQISQSSVVNSEVATCSICLEPFSETCVNENDEENDKRVDTRRLFTCQIDNGKHIFHAYCINQWINESGGIASCPSCRCSMSPEYIINMDYDANVVHTNHEEVIELDPLHLDLLLETGNGIRAHLVGAHLEGRLLQRASLQNAHLERAFLQGIHLEDAILIRTHLKGAHLEHAHLERALLHNVDLTNAKLNGACFENARFQRVSLVGASLYNANFTNAEVVCPLFLEAGGNQLEEIFNFDMLNFVDLENAIFKGAKFYGVNFDHANLTGADFTDATFSGYTSFDGAMLGGAKFINVTGLSDENRRYALEQGAIFDIEE